MNLKSLSLIVAISFAGSNSYSQWTTPSGGYIVSSPASSHVGIGITSTSVLNHKLVVNGSFAFQPSTINYRNIYGYSDIFGIRIHANNNIATGALIDINGNSSSHAHGKSGAITFASGGSGSGNDVAFEFLQYNGGAMNTHMRIYKDGKIALGSTSISRPGAYKLYVPVGILTEKVKVALSSTSEWSDFVFDDDYKLMPLDELNTFISDNRHLPEIPSASEVVKNGLDLAQMDAKLLQKIEELTLYIIQLKDEIDQLKQ